MSGGTSLFFDQGQKYFHREGFSLFCDIEKHYRLTKKDKAGQNSNVLQKV